jgi:hypothetical protein
VGSGGVAAGGVGSVSGLSRLDVQHVGFYRATADGFLKRMNRARFDGRFRVARRTVWYIEVAEIQRDLHRFLECYNLQRRHLYRLQGRTPAQALLKTLGDDQLPPINEGGIPTAAA